MIRVTPIGPNMCILEDLVKGEVETFVEEKRSWWERWFHSLNSWKTGDVDMERMVWLRITGIPCYVWGLSFFSMLAELRGSLIKCDDQTMTKLNMEEARLCIKTSFKNLINDSICVNIDGEEFLISIREYCAWLKEDIGGRRCLDEEYNSGAESMKDDSITAEVAGGEGDSDCVVGPVSCQHHTV